MDDNTPGRPDLPTRAFSGVRARSHVRLRAALALVLTVALTAAACNRDGTSTEPTPEPEGPQTVRIAALLPETGPDAATGVAARFLLEHRLDELNALAATHDPPYTFTLEIVDTASDPATAREGLDELAADGVSIAIGPFSDAEVKAVTSIGDDRGVLIASPGSSAISLALIDNVLRFVPDDEVQAAAIVDLMRRDGISQAALIGRGDPTNAELRDAVAADIELLGGTVVGNVSYEPDETVYEPAVETLSSDLEAVFEEQAPELVPTAVVLAGDDEVAQVLTIAAATPGLADLSWFGSSGFARSAELAANPAAAAFATAVGLPSTTFGLDPETAGRWGPLVELGFEQTGVVPDAVALAAYDALDVIVSAVLELAFIEEDASNAHVRELRAQAIIESVETDGVTGPLKLNEFGDRTTGVFDFWSICEGPTGFEWRRTGVWTPGPDGLVGGTVIGTATC